MINTKEYSSCKDCSDRRLGCHSVCEKYLAFRAAKEKEYEENLKRQREIGYEIKSMNKRKGWW